MTLPLLPSFHFYSYIHLLFPPLRCGLGLELELELEREMEMEVGARMSVGIILTYIHLDNYHYEHLIIITQHFLYCLFQTKFSIP